jgi:hypothetical protein
VAVVVTVVLSRLRLPTVAGLLASGALMGPSGFGWVSSVHDIELLAEVGVMIEPPDPDFLLGPGDQLFLVGRLEAVAAALALLGEPAQRKSDVAL